MADLRAFRGFRYDLGKVGALADVICPPYDVIDAGLQDRLYAGSPHNAVRLELTKDEGDKYAAAARTLNEWVFGGVLQQDTARSLYVLEQEYTVDGVTHVRRGFLGRVRLEPFGTGRIFPHEHTLSGPKADRLKLYQATGFNISPVFSLYPDPTNEVAAVLNGVIRSAPPLAAKDHLGVTNRLWVVTDQAAISQVIGLLGPKPVYIADGHHRYETGLKYKDEVNPTDPEAAANFCLMMLVGMSDPGLLILPTHRLAGGLPDVTREQLKTALAGHFTVVGEFDTAEECWEHVQLEDSQGVLGFGTVADGKWLAVRLTDTTAMATLAPDQSAEWRGLAVSILHKLVLEKLVPEKLGGTPACKYVHLLSEVSAGVAAGGVQLACLVPPCGMTDVEEIAGNREKMPPKSTYFYPKVPTGLILHSLKKD